MRRASRHANSFAQLTGRRNSLPFDRHFLRLRRRIRPEAVQARRLTSIEDVEKYYVQSLATAYSWDASGGKSGASFARTLDDRLVIKCISRTELQMFLDCAPAYFEYLSKAFFHGL